MATISAQELAAIGKQVFADRTTTLSTAAADHSLDDLVDSVRAVRRMVEGTLESLPATAFEAQEAPEGSENWSAGQVLSHVSNIQSGVLQGVRTMLEMEPVAPAPEHDMAAQPSQDEAQAILAQMNQTLDAFIAGIPAGADLDQTAEHPRFGDMSTRGWLLLMALHEGDHINQLRALA